METISYHSFAGYPKNHMLACNLTSDEYPIAVNCAGTTVAKWTFKTDNTQGRTDYYFMYLKTGTLDMTVAGSNYAVHSGTLVFIPPDTPYMYQHTGNDPLVYYWVHFTGSHAGRILRDLGFYPLPLACPMPQASPEIEYQMFKIFDIYIKNGNYRDYELSHCMEGILIGLAGQSGDADNGQKKLSRSIKYINNHYTSDLKVSDLAKMEFLSVSRYTVLFNRIMNTSPYQYIIGLRLDAACKMLRESSLSVTKIAELLGFQNSFFFSKLFKKHMKMSPMQYRKNENTLRNGE